MTSRLSPAQQLLHPLRLREQDVVFLVHVLVHVVLELAKRNE
jgi:hypothetical protein